MDKIQYDKLDIEELKYLIDILWFGNKKALECIEELSTRSSNTRHMNKVRKYLLINSPTNWDDSDLLKLEINYNLGKISLEEYLDKFIGSDAE